MTSNKIRLRDSNNKALGTIGGINPEAKPEHIARFVEGFNGLRNNGVAYVYLVSEALVYSPEDDD